MGMKTVWVVCSGEYSDYGIEAIFSTKEKADKAVKHYNENQKEGSMYAWHEPYEMDVDDLCNGDFRDLWQSTIDEKGNITEQGVMYRKVYTKPRYSNVIVHTSSNNRGTISFTANTQSSVSQLHANKLAVEARQKWLREQGVVNK